MILKKFFGKTIEAAKKSAQQMYGDDFFVLEATEPDEEKEAGITVLLDKKEVGKRVSENGLPKAPESHANGTPKGVKFERSNETPPPNAGDDRPSSKLQALRRYAETQADEEVTPHQNGTNGVHKPSSEQKTAFIPRPAFKETTESAGALYSRASIRSAWMEEGIEESEEHTPKVNSKTNVNGKPSGDAPRTKQSVSQAKVGTDAPVNRREQREIKALHKRFDKVEALLDSALISANLDYVSHPAFQQLVRTGISTSAVAGWFSEIIEQGIDPYDQPEQFMARLSGVIRNALSGEQPGEPQKYLMFTGPAGAGKTQLIMKLSQHPELMPYQKIAVVSVFPQGTNDLPYYTVLEPFCNDHEIPYFKVKSGVEVTQLQQEWDHFDHVLIDTPPISTGKEYSFREYWKIRNLLAPLTPLEVHYVVNVSLNRYYFQHSSAQHHPLQPDYVAITHLDEVSQWGPIIPFLEKMGCGARYISTGISMPDSLDEFNPKWFARKVLQDT